MIEDPELRSMFKIESEEHLERLSAGLLQLEKTPTDSAVLGELFREAHSLKGAARMLNVQTVETIAHQFEDVLGAAKRGHLLLSPDSVDRLYRSLDAIRKFVLESVTGEPSGLEVSNVLAQLGGLLAVYPSGRSQDAPPGPTDSPAVGHGSEDEMEMQNPEPDVNLQGTISAVAASVTESKQEDPPKTGSPGMGEPGQPGPAMPQPVLAGKPGESMPPRPSQPENFWQGYRIETIRVKPQQLDALMTLAGELAVNRIRIGRRVSEIEELIDFWEEWCRKAYSYRFSHSGIERIPNPGGAKHSNHINERERECLEKLGVHLNRIRAAAYEDHTRLDYITNELGERIRNVRLLPLSTIFNSFPRMVRDLSREQSKNVQLIIEGAETTADKRILEEMKDSLMHLIRNAVDHGTETPDERQREGKPRQATIWLRARQTSTKVIIEVRDDGRGLDIEAITRTALKRKLCRKEELETLSPAQIHSFIFASGFSTSPMITDVSGRGVGLDVVRTNVEHLKGTIQVESSPGIGSTFRISLPSTLATARALVVEVDGYRYAVPVEFVQTTCFVSPAEIFRMEGRETIVFNGQAVSIAWLSNILELPAVRPGSRPQRESGSRQHPRHPCIIISIGEQSLGLIVNALIDEQEIVLKPMGPVLKRVRNVSGATILETGDVCMVLNPPDIIRSVRQQKAGGAHEKTAGEAERQKTILLVEDSITTRTQEKRILEAAGYQVTAAVDGLDAWTKLNQDTFDAVVADIQMPNLDGLELTEKIRRDHQYKELPIILVTSLASEEDKRRGLEAGANAYITKPAFDQKVLLDTLSRLV